jgi:hypothetical protein
MESIRPPPESDVNKGPVTIAAMSVVVGATATVVDLRFPVRIWIIKSLWWKDWTILLAIVRWYLESWSKGKSDSALG